MMNKEKKKRKKLIIIDQSVLRLALEGFFFLFSCDEVPLSLSVLCTGLLLVSDGGSPLFSPDSKFSDYAPFGTRENVIDVDR